MKRPFDEVIDIYSSNLSKAVENDKASQEFLHKFTIWLIGFSIGALYLIASNFLSFKAILSYWTLKSIIIFLCVSIITGILHRIILYLFQAQYNSNLFYIEGALSNKIIMQDNPVDVSNEDNVETLINLLKDDFDIDESPILQLYINADIEGKQFLINVLRKKYTDIGAWAVRDYKIAFDHVNLVMKIGLGYTDKELEALTKSSPKTIRLLRKWLIIMLYISCGSFIISLLILTIGY